MRTTERRRRWLVVLAALATAASTMVVATQWLPASAAVAGSNFEIEDGNLIKGGADPAIDWAAVPHTFGEPDADFPEARKNDLPNGSDDDSLGQGSAEDTPCPTAVDGSIPPNKSDLKTFGLYVEENAAGQFLHMFWTRVQDPQGTTNMDFEFNQNDPDTDGCGNEVTPERALGDLLVTYELSKGGTVPNFFLYEWIDETGDSTPKSVCKSANTFPCWGHEVDLDATGDAAGSVNETAIPAGESDGLGALSPFTFGEGTIDLDAVFPDDECVNFGSAYLKSRSSDSFPSALKDFIAPLDFTLTNCGSIQIEKQDSAGDALAGSRFTLYDDNTPFGTALGTEDTPVTTADGGVLDTAIDDDDTSIVLETGDGAGFLTTASVVQIGDELILVASRSGDILTVATDGRGYAGTTAEAHAADATVDEVVSCAPAGDPALCTMVNILFGDYWVVETTVPAGYTGADPQLVTVEDTTALELTFVNSAAPVDLTVHKQTDDATDGTPVPICWDDADDNLDIAEGCAEFELHARTTTALAEAVEANETSIDVDDASGLTAGDEIVVHGASLSNAETMTIGSIATDTLTVVRGDATLTHADGAIVSLLDLSGTAVTCDPADASEAASGDCTFTQVTPGDYWIHESTTPDGYASDSSLPKAITVALGDDSSDHAYTFTNPRLFTVIVLVCSQADDSLYESSVTFQDENLDSLATGDLDGDATFDGLEEEVCGLGGARFEDHTYEDLGDDDNAVDIPQAQE